MLYLLVVYDIASNKRRRRVHSLLSKIGHPIQESAFEMRMERSDWQGLRQIIEEILDSSEDRIVGYALPVDVVQSAWRIGQEPVPERWETMVV